MSSATIAWRRAPLGQPLRLLPPALWAILIVGLGIAIALPSPLLLVAGAVGGLAVVLMAVRPLVGVPLLLLAIPFGTLARGPADTTTSVAAEPSVGLTEVIIGLLVAMWLLRGVPRRAIRVRFEPLSLASLAMLALAAFSIGYAQDTLSAVKEALKWLELLLALLVVVDLARSPGAVRLLLGALFVAGIAEAAYGVAQFALGAGPGFFELDGALRAYGTFDQPNPFAGYLTTILPLAVVMTLSRSSPWPFRGLALACTLALLLGIGLSQSRGAWLGGAVALATLMVGWSARTRRWLIPIVVAGMVGIAMVVSGLLPASIFDRISQAVAYFGVFDVRTVDLTNENFAIVERMAHWQAGWSMFLDHPWLGVGAGNYAAAYPTYFIPPWVEPLGHAHNFYLNMLTELGVVGGVLLLLVVGVAFRIFGGALVASERPQANDRFWRVVLAGVLGGLVVFSVHNLFDSLFVHSVNVQVGVLMGIGLVAVQHLKAAQRLEQVQA